MAVEQIKKVIISFCLLLSVSLVMSQQCFPVECKLDNQHFSSDTCAFWDDDAKTYYLQGCSSSSSCSGFSISKGINFTCTANPTTSVLKWPGEKCTITDSTSNCNTQYATGGCVSGVCQGQKEGGTCSVNDDCNPGLYCDTALRCVSQVGIGGECQNDYQCVNSAGCNKTSTETYGTCVAYFNISSHDPIAECPVGEYTNYLCSSSLCDTTNNGENYCLSSITSKFGSLLPVICQESSECVSSTDSKDGAYLTGQCICGYNKLGYGFCNQYPGDPDYAHLLLMWKKWLWSSAANNCNTNRRRSAVCMADWWDTTDYTMLQYFNLKVTNWPYIQMNDNCTQSVLMAQYYQAQQAYNALRNTTDPDEHGDSSSLILIGSAFMLLTYA
ncbi:unnamed protein product [Blepharisma stoltei]|uniref:Uncharacterized protein n=1 Tax=Blepharisma stoltei TaxID=1481888 RepID=A0AAU9K243_9CILI|nr:unnamed protein product [Blepharisma stoltei]